MSEALSHQEDVERWRARRMARLTARDGWLTLVGLWWLEDGDNPVGSDPSCPVRLPAGKAPARVGVIRVEGGQATFLPEPGSGVHLRGGDATGPIPLTDDAHGDPTVLRLGPFRFHLIEREGDLAVRVKDVEALTRRAFTGVERFPVDERWKVEARFDPHDPPRELRMPAVEGRVETYPNPGALAFEVAGIGCRLETLMEADSSDLFIVFGDLTNGRETFGGGRFVWTSPPDAKGIVALDFNKAYNPPCVFTAYATCPLPLPENQLPFRIEAGEKRYGP